MQTPTAGTPNFDVILSAVLVFHFCVVIYIMSF